MILVDWSNLLQKKAEEQNMVNEILNATELESSIIELAASPQDNGTVEMIVCRPNLSERRVLEQADFDTDEGLLGDNWKARGSRHTEDGKAHPEMQVTLMSSRIIQAIAKERSRWSLAGDQLFLDIDLSEENLPTGQQIAIGTVILEISAYPHTGCKKFTERYGSEATRFVNSREGRQLRRRGVNAIVIQSGTISTGDTVVKIE
jgi:MOSC domain-containing protein YiiM